MKFKVTLKNRLFLYIVSFGNILFAVFSGVMRHDTTLTILSLSSLAFIIIMSFVVKIRYYVFVTDDVLEARTFSSTKRLRWIDIQKIRSVSGGHAFDYIGKNATVRIRFDLFPRACYDQVLRRVLTNNLALTP